MRDWIQKNKKFVVSASSALVLLVSAEVLYRFAGPAVIGWVCDGGLPALLNRIVDPPGPEGIEWFAHRIDGIYRSFTAAVGAVLFLACGAYLVVRGGVRLRYRLLTLLAIWLGVETFAAPHLGAQFGLYTFYIVRDPDHRPPDPMKKPPVWNSDGIRCVWEASEFRPEDLNVVFLGDSFTFGFRLPAEVSFPQQVQALLRDEFPQETVRVANFGWTSSCPLLSLRRLRESGDEYHPDVVVLCLDMGDFHDDIKYGNMLQRRGLYQLFDKIPLTLKAFKSLTPSLFWRVYRWSNDNLPEESFFPCEQPLEVSRPYLQPALDSIDEIDAYSRELGAEFVLFVLPRSFQYSDRECPENWEGDQYTVLGPHSLEPFRFFEEQRERAGYPIHSLLRTFQETSVFPTCFRDDPHWNEAGNEVAAAAIAPILAGLLRERAGDR